MGSFTRLLRLASQNSGRIKQLAEDNADQITATLGKVTARVDAKTEGRHRDKLDKVESAVEKALKKDGPGGRASGDR